MGFAINAIGAISAVRLDKDNDCNSNVDCELCNICIRIVFYKR